MAVSDGTGRRGWGSRSRADRTRRRAGQKDEGPKKVGDFLNDVLERAGVQKDVQRMSALEEWEGRVGPKIAGVTRARSVSDGTLIVEVRSSPWLMELNMMKSEILACVNRDREVPLEKLVFVLSPES